MFAVKAAVGLCLVLSAAVGQPVAANATSAGDSRIDAVVRAFRDECQRHSDSGACVKGKVLDLVEGALRKDSSEENTRSSDTITAIDLLQNIYHECLQEGSLACVKPKILAFLSSSMSKEKIRLTRDLTIVSSSPMSPTTRESSIFNEISRSADLSDEKKESLKLLALDKLDDFLQNHELRIRIPKEISAGEVSAFVPRVLTKNLPEEIKFPLTDGSDQVTGRSRSRFLKRVVMPFLLGLKFKATTLIPLAFALIALKTWKALTLALLSVVLSGAMVIFKFTKPKVNYEVIHYPQPVPVFEAHPHVGHEYPHAHEYPHGHGRLLPAQQLAYSGQL